MSDVRAVLTEALAGHRPYGLDCRCGRPTGPQPAIRPCAMCGASSEFADTFCDVCDDCRATGEILTGTVRIGSWALSPEAAEKIAQEAVQAAVGVIRRRLVECQDEAKRTKELKVRRSENGGSVHNVR